MDSEEQAEQAEDELTGRIYTALRDGGLDAEPPLWTALERALEIVERDVRARGIIGTLRLVTHDWDGQGLAWVEFQGKYHGHGIPPMGSDPREALCQVAETVQETIMALLLRVWPVCATHDRGLHAGWEQGTAVWRCSGDGTHTVAPVGELP